MNFIKPSKSVNISKIKEFINSFDVIDYELFNKDENQIEKRHKLAYHVNIQLLACLLKGEPFEITDDIKKFIFDIVPNKYIINDVLYIYYKLKFWCFDFQLKTAISSDTPPLKVQHIYDCNQLSIHNFCDNASYALLLLRNLVDKYEQDSEYDESNYTRYKEIPISDETYNAIYSLTNEETSRMKEWQSKHNKKYHKKGFGNQGVSPVSNFEVRYGDCSIGTWCDCVCTVCEAQRDRAKDDKEYNKINKYMKYEIRSLE